MNQAAGERVDDQKRATDATTDNSISGDRPQINADEFLGPTGSKIGTRFPSALATTTLTKPTIPRWFEFLGPTGTKWVTKFAPVLATRDAMFEPDWRAELVSAQTNR